MLNINVIRFFYLTIIATLLLSNSSVLAAAPDTIPPVSTLTVNPSVPNGQNGWFVTKPQITITSSDNISGVKAINYRINNGSWIRTENFYGLNIIRNPSFESGYISDWEFVGPFLSIGYKSSLFFLTGGYSAGIISLDPFYDSYFKNSNYIVAEPNKTYFYSMSLRSITSFLDNGYIEIVSLSNGKETILSKQENIDLKFTYKLVSGTFTTSGASNARLFIRIGLRRPYLGHLSIEDVYMAPGGGNPQVSFLLDSEGSNILQFYAEDVKGNIENIKQAVIKVDTASPVFTNFRVTDQDNIQKFASTVDVNDSTSGLVSSPVMFNYSVDGVNDGYYQNYSTCSGSFLTDQFLNPSVNFNNGALLGSVTTPKIDYCDSNWVNCKKLNFYVKDIAGNVSSHVICVNGPYITTNYGDVFGRMSIGQMGIGADYNIWGIAYSGGSVDNISSLSGMKVENYLDFNYLINALYQYYLNKLDAQSLSVDHIGSSSGIYKIDNDYTLTSNPNYSNVTQIVLLNGDLNINSDISATNSNIIYLVNGNVTIGNSVELLNIGIISTNQILTSEDYTLVKKITINGFLYGRNLIFNRNTDRTLGASEIINFPVRFLFKNSVLQEFPIYRFEDYN